MTSLALRVARTAALVAASAVLLAGCAGGDPEPAASTPASVETSEPETAPTVTTSPTPQAAAPACDTLIPQSVVDEFTANNWTYKQDVFQVGDLVLDDGIECVWGDYTVASDHVQIFGWAPISASDAEAARADLITAGWQVVDDPAGDFITENPETAVARDEDGYGLTYQFGDGWVTLSDTKQGLVLIELPAA
jgi:hypothetical protein